MSNSNQTPIIFTICSVNYLAQAKTLADSLMEFHPKIKFIVGLTDKLCDKLIDSKYIEELNLLEVEKIGINDFEKMCEIYDITELNTAVKPFFFEYLFLNFGQSNVIYFDPDIIIFNSLSNLFKHLSNSTLIVTPHILSALPHDNFFPDELSHLQTGIFNLGFIGVSNSKIGMEFIKWWQAKLSKECKVKLENGLFVDQKWIDLAVNLFDNSLIIKDLGANMAYWNFHERRLSFKQNKWKVNEVEDLIFFHFSGYQLKKSSLFSKYQTRFNQNNRPDLIPIFAYYHNQLEKNQNDYFSNFPCSYIKPIRIVKYKRIRNFLTTPFKWLLDRLKKSKI